jgi:hypothetical protein
MKEPIRKITLKDGTVRYRLVVDIGTDEHGKRKQITRTSSKRRAPSWPASATKPARAHTSSRLRKR